MNATGAVDAGSVAGAIVVLLVPAILAALKGRWGLLGVGVLLGVVAALGRQGQAQSTTGGFAYWLGTETPLWLPSLIGAVRLARPRSVWFQRWYDAEKQDRARARFARASSPSRASVPKENNSVSKITLDAATIRNAFAGQADALRQVQDAGNSARTALTEDPGEIVVTRTHALDVMRALAADPQTADTAFTWATLVRTGMDRPGMESLDVEIDPEAEDPVLDAVHALDYLDDGPLPAHHVQQLISALEGPHSAGPPARTL